MPRLGFWTSKQGGMEDDLNSSLANDQVTPPSALEKTAAYMRNHLCGEHTVIPFLSTEIKNTPAHFVSHGAQTCPQWEWRYLE